MSHSGNCWDNVAMENFFSSPKTERTAQTTNRTRDEAKADVFDYIERFYNPRRRHSTFGVSQSNGVRTAGSMSVGWCQPNKQQVIPSPIQRAYVPTQHHKLCTTIDGRFASATTQSTSHWQGSPDQPIIRPAILGTTCL